MSIINKLVFGIYNNQLKDVEKRQKNLKYIDDIKVISDIPYKENSDKFNTYDYFYKKEVNNPNLLPLIINIHGGAFAGGDKSYNKYYASFLAYNNFQVATLNYHFLPQANLKKQIQDCMLGINKIVNNYSLNKDIYLTGDSSGSVLVLLITLIWKNKKLQDIYEVNVPNINIKALGLTGTQASINMFPPFMKAFNNENKRMLFNQCPEIKDYVDIKKMWNENMPPVFIISAVEDVCYKNCIEFDKWLSEKNYEHGSIYCKKKEEGKLFHCFNVIRPDYLCSQKVNLEMIKYFNKF